MKIILTALALMAIFIGPAISAGLDTSTSTAIFEAGPFAIITNQGMQKSDLYGIDTIPTFWFDPVTVRELVQENYYKFEISDVVSIGGELSINTPLIIYITENLNATLNDFAFTNKAIKEISIGRIRTINTTLYSGDVDGVEPHYVEFFVDGFKCLIYTPDSFESYFIERVQNIDIIRKDDFKNYVDKLWTPPTTR